MPDETAPRLLHPVLVSGGGRSGTTLLMLLLGSSPRVVFDRVYPYEHRYLTYLLRWAQLLRPGRAPHSWTQVAMVSRADEMMGPLPWTKADLPQGEPDFWRACFMAAWQEVSVRAVAAVEADHPGVTATHYAEKAPPWLAHELSEMLPSSVLMPVRDPRDVFLSIVAFVARRGRPGFGMEPGEDPQRFARRFVPHQRRRLRQAHEAEQNGTAAVIRYEDLISDLPGQASRIGGLLGLHLDPATLSTPDRPPDQHMTSPTVALSVGRWRREMDPALVTVFRQGLAAELEALGYDV